MKFVKTSLLKFEIHRQINYGVMCVSICLCFLVLSLLVIYSLVLINLIYTDVITMLDNTENNNTSRMIEEVVNHIEDATPTGENIHENKVEVKQV